ncbi:MAG: hypothetical protein AB7F64_00155 [Gammaproteobacteria bacterium]
MSIWKKLKFWGKKPTQDVGKALYPADLISSRNASVQALAAQKFQVSYLSVYNSTFPSFWSDSTWQKQYLEVYGGRRLILKKYPEEVHLTHESREIILQTNAVNFWIICTAWNLDRSLINPQGLFNVPKGILDFPYAVIRNNPYLAELVKQKQINFTHPSDGQSNKRSDVIIEMNDGEIRYELHDRIYCTRVLPDKTQNSVFLGTIITTYRCGAEGFEFIGAKGNVPFTQKLLTENSGVLETLPTQLSLEQNELLGIIHQVIRNTETGASEKLRLFMSAGFPNASSSELKLYQVFNDFLAAHAKSIDVEPSSNVYNLVVQFIPVLHTLYEKSISDRQYKIIYENAKDCFSSLMKDFDFLFNDTYALNLLSPHQKAMLSILRSMVDETYVPKAFEDPEVLKILKTEAIAEQRLLSELFRRHSDSLCVATAFTNADLVSYIPTFVGHGFSHAYARLQRFQLATKEKEKNEMVMEYCCDPTLSPKMRVANFQHFLKDKEEFLSEEMSAAQFIHLLAVDTQNNVLLEQVRRPTKIRRFFSFVDRTLRQWNINLTELFGVRPIHHSMYTKLQEFQNSEGECSLAELSAVKDVIATSAGPSLREHLSALEACERERRVLSTKAEPSTTEPLLQSSIQSAALQPQNKLKDSRKNTGAGTLFSPYKSSRASEMLKEASWLDAQFKNFLPLLQSIETLNMLIDQGEREKKTHQETIHNKNLGQRAKEFAKEDLKEVNDYLKKCLIQKAMLVENLFKCFSNLFKEKRTLIQTPNLLLMLFVDPNENLLHRLLLLNDFRINHMVFNVKELQALLQSLTAPQLIELADRIFFSRSCEGGIHYEMIGCLAIPHNLLEDDFDMVGRNTRAAFNSGLHRVNRQKQLFIQLVADKVYQDFNLKMGPIENIVEELPSSIKFKRELLNYFKLRYLIKNTPEQAFSYLLDEEMLKLSLQDARFLSMVDPLLLLETVLIIKKSFPKLYTAKLTSVTGDFVFELYDCIKLVLTSISEPLPFDLSLITQDPLFRSQISKELGKDNLIRLDADLSASTVSEPKALLLPQAST